MDTLVGCTPIPNRKKNLQGPAELVISFEEPPKVLCLLHQPYFVASNSINVLANRAKKNCAISQTFIKVSQINKRYFLPLLCDFKHLLQVPEQVHLLNIFFI